jgi:DnaJ like chaperone protein
MLVYYASMQFLGKLARKLLRRTLSEADYGEAAVVVAAKLAKVDGAVSRAEIDAFKRLFRIEPDQAPAVARLWDEARRSPKGYETYARRIGELYANAEPVRENLLEALFELASADAPPNRDELDYLRRVARAFSVKSGVYERLSAAYSASVAADPFATLGVRKGARFADIKRTWLKLVRQYHPDALLGRGESRAFIESANEKLAAINAAYEAIERLHKR